jgi:hypothetical protein
MEGGLIWLAIIGVLVAIAVLIVGAAVVLRRRRRSLEP